MTPQQVKEFDERIAKVCKADKSHTTNLSENDD